MGTGDIAGEVMAELFIVVSPNRALVFVYEGSNGLEVLIPTPVPVTGELAVEDTVVASDIFVVVSDKLA